MEATQDSIAAECGSSAGAQPERTPDTFIPLPLQAGAQAMRRLVFDLRHFPTDFSADASDPRDYRAAGELVEAVLREQLACPDPLQRQGFVRALTHLLWCQADDSCVDTVDRWDPLGQTRACFEDAAVASAE